MAVLGDENGGRRWRWTMAVPRSEFLPVSLCDRFYLCGAESARAAEVIGGIAAAADQGAAFSPASGGVDGFVATHWEHLAGLRQCGSSAATLSSEGLTAAGSGRILFGGQGLRGARRLRTAAVLGRAEGGRCKLQRAANSRDPPLDPSLNQQLPRRARQRCRCCRGCSACRRSSRRTLCCAQMLPQPSVRKE